MPLPSPKLDDRHFDDLLAEAQAIIRSRAPDWTDLSPSDPGMTLVELFAFLTDTMLYRLNRIPEKVHVALLDLLGVAPFAPAGAEATLTFSRMGDSKDPVRIPAGTLVSDPSGAVVFATSGDLTLASDAAAGLAGAVNAEFVEGELAGLGTGEPAQTVRVKRPPIIRALGDDNGITVGVESDRSEIDGGVDARKFGGKDFVVWRQVVSFLGLGEKDRAYVLDRADGLVTFAPARGAGTAGSATLAAVPQKGREIRIWYRRGGGRAGNVAAGTLTVLKTPIQGVTVTNSERASGGEDGESLEQALRRGREAVRVLTSAVTARDFERVAIEAGGIARARAFAHRDVWAFGEPGLVEVRIVPTIDRTGIPNGAVTHDLMTRFQTAELAERADALLSARRPLGVRTRVKWTGCRPVSIAARVVISRAEDADAVKGRLLDRLNALIAPDGGWPFGKTLRASDVYEAILAEPGVRYADRLQFAIEDAPTIAVNDVTRDPRQAATFHVAADAGIFRSLDNGRSWVRVYAGERERLLLVRCHPDVPGMVGAVSVEANATGNGGDADAWPVRVSADGGESWDLLERIQGEAVYEIAWTKRAERPTLFVATRKGLRKMELGSERGSKAIDRLTAAGGSGEPGADGFFAVAAGQHVLGVLFVAVAAREKRGVFISLNGGEPGTYQLIPGSAGRDIRTLAFQRDGDRLFLWAGAFAEAGADGEGAIRIEARADGIDPGGWKAMKGWKGGSCLALDVLGSNLVAGSNHAGVVRLDTSAADPTWNATSLDSGLPISVDRRALAPIGAVAVGPIATATRLILAGGAAGLFSSIDGGQHYDEAGQTTFADYAPLPANWLYCSGSHQLTVIHDDEAEG